ncbi:MAG: alpha/beta hydrolase [Burkholderiales bacterium]
MFEVDTEDFDYLSHNGVSLRARLYRPRGPGPFPAMVELHGGSWVKGSYANNDPINRPIAAGGVVILAVDYRVPPAGTYPSSVADANYAIRWLKKNAAKYGSGATRVGVMGTSAGGHLAVLAGMKPFDPRYAAIPLAGGENIDATVVCVVAMWPVICPATRVEENKQRQARGDQSLAHRVGAGFAQMAYWISEDNMVDASPMLALERGDVIQSPDILYVQAKCDTLHAVHNMERFCAAYRKAGGHVEAHLLEGEPYDLVRAAPDSVEAKGAVKRAIEFIKADLA